jgi:BirA family transcriptional regulator, biotin operon repressor / biotin---[acetyl-CoA-carboxylase] ligase
MSVAGSGDISAWTTRLDAAIGAIDRCCVERVLVLESTQSTMDAAVNAAGDLPGLLVVAFEQTTGRGQRGRGWHDGDRKTLPCTLMIDAEGLAAPMLSAMVGCAVHETIVHYAPPSSVLLIKWPNDIVVRVEQSGHDRKIAGILIEQSQHLASIGIGINCAQSSTDWDNELRDRAVSLTQLGAPVSRLDLLCTLIERLSHWLNARDPEMVREYWAKHDAMVGTTRAFTSNNNRIVGIVERIDPLGSIVVRNDEGTVALPPAQTHHDRA